MSCLFSLYLRRVYILWVQHVDFGNSFSLPSFSSLSYSCWSCCVFIFLCLFCRNISFCSSGVGSGNASLIFLYFLLRFTLCNEVIKIVFNSMLHFFRNQMDCMLHHLGLVRTLYWFCGWLRTSLCILFCALINSFLGIRLYGSSVTSLSFIKSIFFCFTLLPSTNILFRSLMVKIFLLFCSLFLHQLVYHTVPLT